MNRYLRESSFWDMHLQNTRNFIQHAFQDTQIKTVAVLGSGWLLDVPLKWMRKRFEQVYLVDIHHPVQIRKKVSSMNHVELVEAELSGGAVEQIWEMTRSNPALMNGHVADHLTLTPPLSHLHADAVISLNLLNQLDIVLCDFLSGFSYFQQEPQDPIRRAIQDFHLQWIRQTPGCLISDVQEILSDRSGNKVSKSLLYTGLPEGITVASVLIYLEPWAAARSGEVVELGDFSLFDFMKKEGQ